MNHNLIKITLDFKSTAYTFKYLRKSLFEILEIDVQKPNVKKDIALLERYKDAISYYKKPEVFKGLFFSLGSMAIMAKSFKQDMSEESQVIISELFNKWHSIPNQNEYRDDINSFIDDDTQEVNKESIILPYLESQMNSYIVKVDLILPTAAKCSIYLCVNEEQFSKVDWLTSERKSA